MSEKTKNNELGNKEKQVPETPQEKKSLFQKMKESEKLQKFGAKAKPILKGLALFAGGVVVGIAGDRILGYEDEDILDADYEETGSDDYSSDEDE